MGRYGGITKEDCNERGCCYDETSPHRSGKYSKTRIKTENKK